MSITKKVNKTYKKNNPSTYLRNFKLLNKFICLVRATLLTIKPLYYNTYDTY